MSSTNENTEVMNKQQTLFDDGRDDHAADLEHKRQAAKRPPHNNTETSKKAADSMKSHTGRLRMEIVAELVKHDSGLTCDQLEVLLEMSHQTCSARVSELYRDGRIFRDGKRPTRSGRSAFVYKIQVATIR